MTAQGRCIYSAMATCLLFCLLTHWFAGTNQGMDIPFSIWPTYFWSFRTEPVFNWWTVQSGSILGLLRYLLVLYTYHNPNCTKKNFFRTSKRLLKQNIKIIFVILYKVFKIVMGKSVKIPWIWMSDVALKYKMQVCCHGNQGNMELFKKIFDFLIIPTAALYKSW